MASKRLVAGGIFRVGSYLVRTATLRCLIRWERYKRDERAAFTRSWLQLADHDPRFGRATGNLARDGTPESMGSLGMRTEPVPVDLFGKINRRRCRSSQVDNQHSELDISWSSDGISLLGSPDRHAARPLTRHWGSPSIRKPQVH